MNLQQQVSPILDEEATFDATLCEDCDMSTLVGIQALPVLAQSYKEELYLCRGCYEQAAAASEVVKAYYCEECNAPISPELKAEICEECLVSINQAENDFTAPVTAPVPLSGLTDSQLLAHYSQAHNLYMIEEVPGESTFDYNDRVQTANEILDSVHRHFWYRPGCFAYAAYTAPPEMTLQVVSINGRQELMVMLGRADESPTNDTVEDESPMGTWDSRLHWAAQGAISPPPTYIPPQTSQISSSAALLSRGFFKDINGYRVLGYRLTETFDNVMDAYEAFDAHQVSPDFIEGAIYHPRSKFPQLNRYHVTTYHVRPILHGLYVYVGTYPNLDTKSDLFVFQNQYTEATTCRGASCILAARLHPQFNAPPIEDFDEMMSFID